MISHQETNSITKILPLYKREEILKRTNTFKSLILKEEQIQDVKNIARGVYSPLTGFLREEDFSEAVAKMRLKNGEVWPIPIVLDLSATDYSQIKKEKNIILTDRNNSPIALLEDIEIFSYDKKFFAKNVYQTLNRDHPGVREIYKMGKYLIGGEIRLLDDSRKPFPEYNFTPKETSEIFKKRGWKSIVAFQTRNVPHRGHEFLQKYALQETDGLFIQPIIGKKKLKDCKDEFILASYEFLIERYYPQNRVLLGILSMEMRYAGPREAVLHAIIRKNFGCTHFIVGRDHAGVGNYYSPSAAQEIFDRFRKEEIGIEILKYPEVVYCQSKRKHTFINKCSQKNKISFSGTQLREYIKKGTKLPSYIIRPEIFNLLINSQNPLVDKMYKKGSGDQEGFVLWFTGLSQSGKSTIADRVYGVLKEKGIRVERLDGDVVRKSLSRELGFSKKDRDENIKRVGILARLLSRNGIGVIASFISPYRHQREELRKEIQNFIEVFCKCPLEICEKRDKKGMYRKARQGEIQSFTGISDPYEEPERPEIELETDKESIRQSTDKIIKYLIKRHIKA